MYTNLFLCLVNECDSGCVVVLHCNDLASKFGGTGSPPPPKGVRCGAKALTGFIMSKNEAFCGIYNIN